MVLNFHPPEIGEHAQKNYNQGVFVVEENRVNLIHRNEREMGQCFYFLFFY